MRIFRQCLSEGASAGATRWGDCDYTVNRAMGRSLTVEAIRCAGGQAPRIQHTVLHRFFTVGIPSLWAAIHERE